MKKLSALFFCIALLFFFHGDALAQVKPKTEIALVKQVDKTVVFTLISSKPFIFGGNRYILYIGDKEFFLNKQWTEEDGMGKISFFIPAEDFNNLTEGATAYLTYGNVFRNVAEQEREGISKQNRMCWPLGKFSKSLLTK